MQRIDLDFCSEPVDLFCPVCGVQLFSRGNRSNSCRHLLFWGDSASGQWTWVQETYLPAFNQVVEQLYAEACGKGFHDSQAVYRAAIKSAKAATIAAEVVTHPSAFMICISTSDIGCGGMHNGTFYALFDYNPARQKLIRDFPVILQDE